MSAASIALATGCVLQVAETRVAPLGEGWLETTHLEVVATPACRWVALTLPADAVLGAHRAKQKLGDGTGMRLGEERWEQPPRAIDGSGRAVLHTPELLGGDRVFLDFERHLPAGSFEWRPGPARFVSAELDSDDPARILTSPAGAAKAVWKAEPSADWTAGFSGGPPGPGPTAKGLAAGEVTVDEVWTLRVPPGDPLIALYPGGGSSVEVAQQLAFSASESPRIWPLDAAGEIPIELRSEPAGVALLEQDRGGARVVISPSEGPTRVHLRWVQPDAPTMGEVGDRRSLQVAVTDGDIRWEGDAWYLQRVRDRAIVPSRDLLLRGLDGRFRAASLPEPGAPLELRGRSANWDTAAALRPTLLARVAIGDWPVDPLFPRRLNKARRSSALTPIEAGLTLWLYANQLHLDADWVLVRPAPLGPGPESVPVGAQAMLVRIRIGDEERWIDPTCSVCGPFELRPALEGARAFGRDHGPQTPPPSPGRLEVTRTGDQVVWDLEGSAALWLRLRLAEIAPEARTAALASLVGGPGAVLSWTQGLDQAGGPVQVQTSRGDGLALDPLELPPADGSGTAWVDWVGERVLRSPDVDVPEALLDEGPLHYRRSREDGAVVERLQLDARTLDGSAVARLDTLRHPPAVDAPPEADPDGISRPEPAPGPP